MCSDVTVTQGDFDEGTAWPDTAVVTIGDLRVGVCHGHQVVPWGDREALAIVQRRLDCDILVTGHTHVRGWGGDAVGACGKVPCVDALHAGCAAAALLPHPCPRH